jgi:hypothetical protein
MGEIIRLTEPVAILSRNISRSWSRSGISPGMEQGRKLVCAALVFLLRWSQLLNREAKIVNGCSSR